MNDLTNAHVLLNNADENSQDTYICQGCVLYKEGKFKEALGKFEEAKVHGETPDVEYNIAVCHYKTGNISKACTCFESILDKAAHNHPEIISPGRTDGIGKSSMANNPAL